MSHRARLPVLLTAVAGALGLALTVVSSHGGGAVTATLRLAVSWGFLISILDAAISWRWRDIPRFDPSSARSSGSISFVMSVGDQRRDIARTNIILAAQAGAVHVVSTRHHDVLDELGSSVVTEHVAPTIQEALHDAAMAVDTDAVLLLSAGAFPIGASCAQIADQLTGDVGWVIGTAPVFNHDRYAPGERELLSARMRSAGRRIGLVTWEPDATIVRTSLLREHPFDPTGPYGRWLRARAADGYRGLLYEDPVAVQAAPADAPVFWPLRARRQRGVVADLADATTTGPVRARAAAAAALMRELVAYPLLLWLAVVVLVGRSGEFPLRMAPVTFFAMQASLSGARWATSRISYGIGLHPIEEARATAYDLPGSLLALPSAITRRVRRGRLMLPDQPLLWAAIALTLVATAPLVDRRAETNGAIGVTVALTLAALMTSWVYAMRAFGARGWDRASYRIPLDRPATIEGKPARTIDVSPSGLALAGVPETLGPGDPVSVTITFDHATVVTVRGNVTDSRGTGSEQSVGIELDLNDDERVTWIRQLFSATGLSTAAPKSSEVRNARRQLAFERQPARVRRAFASVVPAAAVLAVSLLVLSALLLAFLGYRPMVERSGSMVPKLKVGDVVVTEWVRADRIRPGEIVTFPQDIGRTELVTHRVQSVSVRGPVVRVVTKGDANDESERWSTGTESLVGRVVWQVPRIGALLVLLGSTAIRRLLIMLGVAVLIFGAFAALARRKRSAAAVA